MSYNKTTKVGTSYKRARYCEIITPSGQQFDMIRWHEEEVLNMSGGQIKAAPSGMIDVALFPYVLEENIPILDPKTGKETGEINVGDLMNAIHSLHVFMGKRKELQEQGLYTPPAPPPLI